MTRPSATSRLLAIAVLGAFALSALACAPVRTPGLPVAAVSAPAAAPVAAEVSPPPAVAAPVAPAKMIAWGPAPGLVAGASSAPGISGESAILIDEASGVSLYEKDPHTRMPPASLTKIMTALVALERGQPGDPVEVSIDSRRMRGSTVMGLVPGERLTLEELVYGMMLPSGNDAALAIADHISGSTEAFVGLMNQRAAELGLINTHFANPHGLDNAAHYSSAFDLAVLTRVAMQREDFRTIANTKYRVVSGMLATYHLGTLNPLYGRLAGVDGVKTGYTRTARQTLVGTATRDGHRLLVVILRSPDRAWDGTALLNWAFETHTWRTSASTVAGPDPAAIPGT